MRRITPLLVPLLLGLAACRPPVPAAPSRDQALEQAAQAAAVTVPVARQADFIRGFHMGARMVWEAASRHHVPWLPLLGTPAPPPLPAAARTLGATPGKPGPEVEVDPGTGFPISRLEAQDPGFNPGEVAGFAWALAPLRDQLCHPRPLPAFPDKGHWERWTPSGLRLRSEQDPGLQVQVAGSGNLLAWSWVDRGFPPQRSWRSLEGGVVPVAVALRERCLWIATKEEGCVALDLATGLIVRVREGALDPADIRDPDREAKDWKARLEREEQEALRLRPGWLEKAARGDTGAMLSLAWQAEDLPERAAWFRKAAEAGDPDGMYEFGVLCYQGRGVPADRAGARRWFERAAKAGHARAAELLKGLDP